MINVKSKYVNGCKIHPNAKIISLKNNQNTCEQCVEFKRIEKQKLFVERSKKVHNNKYNYGNVVYKRNDEKVIIECPYHGDFLQCPSNHARGQGCDRCLNESLTYTQNEVLEKFKEVHGNVYDYSKVIYINWKSKVVIKCNKHGEFLQSPGKHIDGQGCPKCKMSHGERKIEQFLIKHNLQYRHQHTFSDCVVPGTKTRLRFDFYLSDYNLAIEYDGEQHFLPRNFGNISEKRASENLKRVKYLDNLKNTYAKNNKINLIRISYKKLKIIENRLSSLFKNIIKYGNTSNQ